MSMKIGGKWAEKGGKRVDLFANTSRDRDA